MREKRHENAKKHISATVCCSQCHVAETFISSVYYICASLGLRGSPALVSHKCTQNSFLLYRQLLKTTFTPGAIFNIAIMAVKFGLTNKGCKEVGESDKGNMGKLREKEGRQYTGRYT